MIELTKDECARAASFLRDKIKVIVQEDIREVGGPGYALRQLQLQALEYSAEQFEVGVRFAYEQKVRR